MNYKTFLIVLFSSIASAQVTEVTAGAPIYSTGGPTPYITCVMATTDTPGCISAGFQRFSGEKRADNIWRFDVGIHTSYIEAPLADTGLYVLSKRTASSINGDFAVDTANFRTAGCLGEFYNQGVDQICLEHDGTVTSNGPNSDIAFLDNNPGSGHIALAPRGGKYLYIIGRLPAGYNGNHGALTVANISEDGGPLALDGGIVIQGMGQSDNAFTAYYNGIVKAGSAFQTSIADAELHACTGAEGRGGVMSFVRDRNAIALCTMDGGYENMCTENNGRCNKRGLIELHEGYGISTEFINTGSLCTCTNTSSEAQPRCWIEPGYPNTLRATVGNSNDIVSFNCGLP